MSGNRRKTDQESYNKAICYVGTAVKALINQLQAYCVACMVLTFTELTIKRNLQAQRVRILMRRSEERIEALNIATTSYLRLISSCPKSFD